MARGEASAVFRDVHTLFNLGTMAGLSDGELLERFAGRGDEAAEAAFAVLVARHGPMVLGVCRRALNDPNDVNDAFQATFLVLVRKADSVRVEDSLGRWLYGVSRRVSLRARADAAGRSAREVGGVESATAPAGDGDPDRGELGVVLDEEIGRLPEKYRHAVVLCELEGLSHDEAATQLGCAVGTVKSRLSRAREKLRSRLIRRGLAPSAGALALHEQAASAAVPPSLAAATVESAVSSGTVPGAIDVLARGVMRAMFLNRLRSSASTIVTIVGMVVGGAVLARPGVDAGAPADGEIALPEVDDGSSAANWPAEDVPTRREFDRAAPEAPIAKAADDLPPAESGVTVTESVVLRPFLDRAWYAAFSPDGRSLVTGTNTSGAIRIYDVASRKEVGLLAGEAKTGFACAAFSPDGRLLATSGAYRILVWDFAARQLVTRFMAHVKGVRALAFSPDGKTLASASEDRTVKQWEVGTWQERPRALTVLEPACSVAFSPDGKTLAVASGDYREPLPPRVTLCDDDAGRLNERLKLATGHKGPAWSVAFSPDGRRLASSSFDPMVKLWDPSSGNDLGTLELPQGLSARGLAFSPDGKTIAAGVFDGSIAVWEVGSRRKVATLRGHVEHIFTVAFSPDGKTLASAGRDGTVRLWDLTGLLP